MLKKVHLDVPQVTELSARLRKQGVPLPADVLTVEEFVEQMTVILQRRVRDGGGNVHFTK